MMKHVFWNRAEQRVRSGWRLVLAVLMAAAISLPPLIAFPFATTQLHLILSVSPCIMAAGVLVSVGIAARLLDRRPMSDFGLRLDRCWWIDLGFGLTLGAVLVTAIFVVQWAAGWIGITGWLGAGPSDSFGAFFSSMALLFVCVGIYEEVAYRGYLMHNIAEGLNFPAVGASAATMAALLLTSGLFGVMHAANPNASLLSVTNTMLPGCVFGLGYLLTGQLAIPIGMHITWNFFQGAVFGFPVSGIVFGGSLIVTDPRGPAVWTGGVYGPEGGLLGTAAMLVGAALMVAWIHHRYGTVALDRSLAQPPAPPRSAEELASSGGAP